MSADDYERGFAAGFERGFKAGREFTSPSPVTTPYITGPCVAGWPLPSGSTFVQRVIDGPNISYGMSENGVG